MSTVAVLQHIGCEGLGRIEAPLHALGVGHKVFGAYASLALPGSVTDFDGLIVMGGPQSAYETDKFPYLIDEIRLIGEAIDAHRPILAVCLGAQLLATTLGARVYANSDPEIGWYDVMLSPDAEADSLWQGAPHKSRLFHWHGDVFDLPGGAVHLASSVLTPNQAFRYGDNAWGLQMHLEVDLPIIQEWCDEFQGSDDGENRRAEIMHGATHYLAGQQAVGDRVFANWAKIAAESKF